MQNSLLPWIRTLCLHPMHQPPLPPPPPPHPQDILHQIGEQGKLFCMKDYSTALKLIGQGRPNSDPSKMQAVMKKLDQIFSSDTV